MTTANIKINKIEAAKLPPIDDELAKKFGVENLAELRNQVRNHMEQELNKVLKNKLKVQLIDKLVADNPLELPKALLEKECQHLEKEWLERLRQNTRSPDATLPLEAKDKIIEVARRRVSVSLLFSEIIERHNLQVEEKRVHEHILKIAGSFQEPQAIIGMIKKQPEILKGIQAQVMEEQVVDKLLEEVQYTEKTAAYNQVMQFNGDAASAALASMQHEHEHEDEHVHDEHCTHDH